MSDLDGKSWWIADSHLSVYDPEAHDPMIRLNFLKQKEADRVAGSGRGKNGKAKQVQNAGIGRGSSVSLDGIVLEEGLNYEQPVDWGNLANNLFKKKTPEEIAREEV